MRASLLLLPLLALTGARSWDPLQNGWSIVGEAMPEYLVPLTVGLRHDAQAVAKLAGIVEAVSEPDSPQYGQHLSLDELTSFMAPSDATIAAVSSYLSSCGGQDIEATLSRDFLTLSARAGELSACLGGAKFLLYQHNSSGRRVMRAAGAAEWTWPASIASAVDVVLGVTDFLDTPLERKGITATVRAAQRAAAGACERVCVCVLAYVRSWA